MAHHHSLRLDNQRSRRRVAFGSWRFVRPFFVSRGGTLLAF
jgi:hypothetical protein